MNGQVRRGDIEAALRPLIPEAALTVKHGARLGEFTVAMPLISAQRIGVMNADGGGYAGLVISQALGQRIHITGWRGLRHDVRHGYRAEVTLRLHAHARAEAARVLADAGYPPAEADTVLAEAEQFPTRWAYPADRRRGVVFHMPGGAWETADTAETEARIAAHRTRPEGGRP